jgi:hypothetical protein
MAQAMRLASVGFASMIDKSGEWWTGSAFDDLVTYLREVTADSHPAGPVVQSTCECGGRLFTLEADADEGCARRTCTSCGRVAPIADSAEYWDDAEPEAVQCPCGEDAFETGVAIALREDGDVRWITVGVRCVACGVLGAPVDWKIDYSPTDHLLTAA